MMNRTYQDELDILVGKVEGDNNYEWAELVDRLDLNCHPDSLRKSFNVGRYSGYRVYKYFQDRFENEMCCDEEIERLENLKREIEIERKKKQAVNREYNATNRIVARNELFKELVLEEISHLKPIEVKTFAHKQSTNRTAIVCVADAHYGEQFELNGLFGEMVNKYDTEIFKTRMWNLLAQLESEKRRANFDKLLVWDIGDCISGILRMGSLQKLQTGVIQSAIEYAEFMSIWLCEAYNRLNVPIEYSLRGGNHDMLRLLTEKKVFEDENIAKVIYEYINLRIKNAKLQCSNIDDKLQIEVAPYSDIIYHNIYGMNVLSYHGDSKSLKEDIEFFENYYNINIDIVITGHLHRNSQETIGIGYNGDREIMRVPSIMGVNDYAKRIRKSSRAGCKFMVFSEDGKDYEKIFYLN
jgi:hypothetical protein